MGCFHSAGENRENRVYEQVHQVGIEGLGPGIEQRDVNLAVVVFPFVPVIAKSKALLAGVPSSNTQLCGDSPPLALVMILPGVDRPCA